MIGRLGGRQTLVSIVFRRLCGRPSDRPNEGYKELYKSFGHAGGSMTLDYREFWKSLIVSVDGVVYRDNPKIKIYKF